MTYYSVQQIKFEFLSYIKEFQGNDGHWQIGVCEDPEATLFAGEDAVDAACPWLWKPALTSRAADTVVDFFCSRFDLRTAPGHSPGPDANCIFLYRDVVS